MTAGSDTTTLELYLPATEAAIGQARRFVDRLEVLDRHEDVRSSVRLLVSELFTNAVKYGSRREASRIRLTVAVTDTHVRGEIGDRGRGFAEAETTMPDGDAESGRGLAFLDALADRWGIVRNGESCVWFELDL
ncbi:MAG TPA: ATP-binding protein [Gaiellaceae bacterium]|nr:ATP-binding protein [Gaiellaceae bacterium]